MEAGCWCSALWLVLLVNRVRVNPYASLGSLLARSSFTIVNFYLLLRDFAGFWLIVLHTGCVLRFWIFRLAVMVLLRRMVRLLLLL